MPHQFQLNPKLNLIHEQIAFPSLLRYDLELSKTMQLQDQALLIDETYNQMVTSAQTRLKPFKAQIDQFYFENELSILRMLLTYFDLESSDTLEAYLDHLMDQEENTLQQAMVYACLVREQFAGFQPKLWEEAQVILGNQGSLMPWLQSLNYGPETKWQLLNIIQTPKSSLQTYQELMMALKPHFEEVYINFVHRLEPETQAFIDKLKAQEKDPISGLTNGIVKDDLIPNGPVHVSLSFLQAYHIQVLTSLKTPLLIWGYKTEEYIAQQKKANEDASAEKALVCKNLGDKTRFQVALLVSTGIHSTKVIADKLGVTAATVSYHLNQLVASHIIILDVVDGKYEYVINRSYMAQVLEALLKDFG